jgi:hypothetical protein
MSVLYKYILVALFLSNGIIASTYEDRMDDWTSSSDEDRGCVPPF